MNASKEEAKKAKEDLFRIIESSPSLLSPFKKEIQRLCQFFNAAERKLPTEAAYERERKRKRGEKPMKIWNIRRFGNFLGKIQATTKEAALKEAKSRYGKLPNGADDSLGLAVYPAMDQSPESVKPENHYHPPSAAHPASCRGCTVDESFWGTTIKKAGE